MSASALADEQGRKIFLGGLSFDAREGDLRSDFSKYGELEDVQLPMGDGGKHKGFAFLTYVKAEDAQEACKVHHSSSTWAVRSAPRSSSRAPIAAAIAAAAAAAAIFQLSRESRKTSWKIGWLRSAGGTSRPPIGCVPS
jgi:RNA recognition motif-containing protein